MFSCLNFKTEARFLQTSRSMCHLLRGNPHFAGKVHTIIVIILLSHFPSRIISRRPCETKAGQKGVCCPIDNAQQVVGPRQKPQGTGVGANGVLTAPPPPQVVIPRLSRKELENIAERSVAKFQERVERISDLLFNKRVSYTLFRPIKLGKEFGLISL